MNYTQLIDAVYTAVAPLAEANGGTVEIVETLAEARAALDTAPGRWRIILHWEGYGEHPEARLGMTFHQVATVVQTSRGLVHKPSPIAATPGGRPSIASLIEQVSLWMAALKFPNGTGADSAGFAKVGSQWLDSASGTAAHVFDWRLEAADPAFDENIVLSFPHLNP